MNSYNLPFAWSVSADFLTAVSFILTFYIFFLNPRQRANRLVSLAMFVIAVTNLGLILAYRARLAAQAEAPLTIIAALSPAIGPLLFLATMALIKPAWMEGRKRWFSGVFWLLAALPGLLTLTDRLLGTRLYYPGLDPLTYQGGYLEYLDLLTGVLGPFVVYGLMIGLNSSLLLPLAYLAFFDRTLSRTTQRLAQLLFATQILTVIINMGLRDILPPGIASLIGSMFFVLAYAYSAFQQMISERRYQSGQLRTRLTALTMAVSLPLLVLISNSLIYQARDLLENMALRYLEDRSRSVALGAESWLENNVSILRSLASQPDIISMDAARQRPILQAVAASYPYMYLVSTTDTRGINVARSDDEAPKDYSDRLWYKNAAAGAEVTFQVLIGRTTGRPALVVSTPIRDSNGQILGVVMFASELTAISDLVVEAKIGQTGFSYLVNESDVLLAHPSIDELMLQAGGDQPKLVSFAEDMPVAALRAGKTPPLRYSDAQGVQWVAYYRQLENGWGLVAQQRADEILASARLLQRTAWGVILGGGVVLFLFVWATMRQAFQPVAALTETVKAITAGSLDRVAAVESGDEIGTLAQAFNVMTSRLRELISSLERRVAERTLDLETRSAQLQAAAEVGRAVATIRNLDELLPLVTRLISERFGFYHVGIFLLDENKEFAVLRAANSEGGRRMLERGHRLRVGQQGIVGYVTQQRKPRIALNVGEDAAFFNNPDLPDTQSEMALPLIVGDELLGALDVQSTQVSAFSTQDVQTLSVLADQVAIAINQARLLRQTEQLLETERRLYGEISRRAWVEQVRAKGSLGILRNQSGLMQVSEIQDPQIRRALETGQTVVDLHNMSVLYVPIKVRGQVVGILRTRRPEEAGGWTEEDIRLVEGLAEQLAISLESARSYQESQNLARRERLLGEISARVRQTLDLNSIVKIASQEVRQALDLSRVVVHLGVPPSARSHGGDGHGSLGGDGHG